MLVKVKTLTVLGLVVCVVAGGVAPVEGASFYVATNGTAVGDGSIAHPWDLQTALRDNTKAANSNSVVKPGDTIWLLGGVYRGGITSYLTGSEQMPIGVRQYAGERATIQATNCSTLGLLIQGRWANYWGFEVSNSDTNRTLARGTGVDVQGPGTRLINLVVHDTGVGIDCWTEATNSEIHGCLIYNNGYQGPEPDRGHGHGIYAQSSEPGHALGENIIFNQFGYGIHCYAEGGLLWGFRIEGNTSFNNGAISRSGSRAGNLLVGGYTPVRDLNLLNNFGYHTPGAGGFNLQLGYGQIQKGLYSNRDVIARSNYFGGGYVSVVYWTNLTLTDNTFALLAGNVRFDPGPGAESHVWNHNRYFLSAASAYSYMGTNLTFANWKTATGFDADSELASQHPTGVQVFVRTNAYEPGRAHIIVYNWDIKDAVEVDVSGVMAAGTTYEVRNAQDFFGAVVLTGKYDGQPLRLPMTGLSVAKPIGFDTAPSPTGPEFNVFMLLAQSGITLGPPRNLRAPN